MPIFATYNHLSIRAAIFSKNFVIVENTYHIFPEKSDMVIIDVTNLRLKSVSCLCKSKLFSLIPKTSYENLNKISIFVFENRYPDPNYK